MQPRVDRKSDQIYPAFSRTRADLSKPPQPIVVLAPKVDSLREYCIAEGANPLYARDASVARRQKCSPLFRESLCCAAPMRIRR